MMIPLIEGSMLSPMPVEFVVPGLAYLIKKEGKFIVSIP
jgi:hypothetical protein